MKRGTEYAKRIKRLSQQVLKKFGKPELPELTDPIQQLIIGILAENASGSKAAALFKHICEQMVDLNELRVTPAMELVEMIGSTVPQAREKAERIVRVLNEIRLRQDSLDLSFLKQRGRREAREFLESLDGVGLYAAASVVVHSLGGHAIPVDFLTVYVLRKDEVVDDTADAAAVQGFLERNVHAADGRQFAILLNRHVSTQGARVQVNRLPELLNLKPPPPPKPLRRPGMEKPGAIPPKDGDGVPPDLDGLDIDEAVRVAKVEPKAGAGHQLPRKPENSHAAAKKPKKNTPAPAAPAKKNANAVASKPKPKVQPSAGKKRK
jgi:endonuclease III